MCCLLPVDRAEDWVALVGIGARWPVVVGVVAVQGERSVLQAVEDTGEPAVVPVDGTGEGGVVFGVGGVPGEPEGGKFFDELGVLGPAVGDASGERVAVPDPGAPAGELRPQRVGS